MGDGFSQFGLSQIGQISINAKELKRAIQFYRDTLGMKFLFEAPPQMAFFDCGGIRLLLGVPEKPEFDHPASILYYRVSDIQEAHSVLKNRGVEFIAEPHSVHRTDQMELWLAFFRDSEGNVLSMMSEVEL